MQYYKEKGQDVSLKLNLYSSFSQFKLDRTSQNAFLPISTKNTQKKGGYYDDDDDDDDDADDDDDDDDKFDEYYGDSRSDLKRQ